MRTGQLDRALKAAVFIPLIMAMLSLATSPTRQPQALIVAMSTSVLVFLLAACSVTDLLWHKIPNWATYTAVAWALTLNLAASLFLPTETLEAGSSIAVRSGPTFASILIEPIGFGQSLLGMGTCFVIMLLAYQFVGTGAGDVKLATAVGALLGTERGLSVLAFCHLTAGAVILCWMIWKTGPVTFFQMFCRQMGSLLFPRLVSPPDTATQRALTRPVPLAAFFAIGTILTLWKGVLVS